MLRRACTLLRRNRKACRSKAKRTRLGHSVALERQTDQISIYWRIYSAVLLPTVYRFSWDEREIIFSRAVQTDTLSAITIYTALVILNLLMTVYHRIGIALHSPLSPFFCYFWLAKFQHYLNASMSECSKGLYSFMLCFLCKVLLKIVLALSSISQNQFSKILLKIVLAKQF